MEIESNSTRFWAIAADGCWDVLTFAPGFWVVAFASSFWVEPCPPEKATRLVFS